MFDSFVSSATAYEKCDRKYKAVFAEPKKPKEEREREERARERDREMPISHSYKNGRGSGSSSSTSVLPRPDNCRDEGYNKLMVIASPLVNQDQMWKLFDIVPSKSC